MTMIEKRITEIISTEHLTRAVEAITELIKEETSKSYSEGYHSAKNESSLIKEFSEVLI
tara:strand:+ start:462 stop:638 length:177 start_codon:yes stop_codon:yes gene_type:complete